MTIKLFFFDLEGTLINGASGTSEAGSTNMWARIARALGERGIAADKRMYEKWESGGYTNYFEWIEECMRTYQQEGLTREQLREIVNTMAYNVGVRETIAALHEKGIKTAIISGGFMSLAKRAQRDLKIKHALAAAGFFWNEQGTIEHWNILPADHEGKIDFVELLRREYKLTKDECAFVGDGKNDVHIAKHVGLSFAYNAHPNLQQAATHSISDFRSILEYLE